MIEKIRQEIVIDDAGNTSVIHPETSSDNVLHMGSTVDKMITLGGESKQNFNFTANEVVQDGLIISDVSTFKTKDIQNVKSLKCIMFSCTTSGFNAGGDANQGILSYSDGSYIYELTTHFITGQLSIAIKEAKSQNVVLNTTYDFFVKKGIKYLYCIYFDGVNTKILIDGNIAIQTGIVGGGIGIIADYVLAFGKRTNIIVSELNEFNWYFGYNRQLTPQEIQHNFNVPNNSPSISHLETTDSNNIRTKQLFCSDTDHVEDRTGRTQEEINRTFYKRNCKEFVAGANGEIKVENGEQGYVLSGSIEGQTVKNYVPQENTLKNGYNYPTMNTSILTRLVANALNAIDTQKTYSLIVDVIEFSPTSSNPTWGLYFSGQEKTVGAYNVGLGVNTKITNKRIIKKLPNLNLSANLDRPFELKFHSDSGVGSTCSIKNIAILADEDANKISKEFGTYIPFGLTSTEASITSNGIKHTFYASEEDKINQKPILLPFAEDKFTLNEDGSGTWVDASDRLILTGNESWVLYKNNPQTISFNLLGGLKYNTIENNGISNMFNVWDIQYSDREGIMTKPSNAFYIGVLKSKLSTQDVNGFVEYLKNNQVVFDYKRSNPTTTHIPKSIMPTIPIADKINILSVGDAVKASKFTASLPVDRISELDARLKALENVTIQNTLK